MVSSEKFTYLKKLLYSEWPDFDDGYQAKLHILSALSQYHHQSVLRVLIAYFQGWYTDKANDDGQPGEPEFIEDMIERFLAIQSTEYLQSLENLIPKTKTSDRKILIESITNKICELCLNKPNGESYHDVVKKNLNLDPQREFVILNENMPDHWYSQWSYGDFDDLFMGGQFPLPSDLVPDTLSDEIITTIIDSIPKETLERFK